VERAGPEALAALAALGVASLASGWSEAALAAELTLPDRSIWIARAAASQSAAAEPAGFLLAHPVADELHVLLLVVAEASRRRGAGSALLDHALATARGAGIAAVHLEVRASNRAALAFYRRHGFSHVGRRRLYYDGREDALLLTLRLAGAGRG
jgi:ribosomal-protein-alanine N-acetyltransferase